MNTSRSKTRVVYVFQTTIQKSTTTSLQAQQKPKPTSPFSAHSDQTTTMNKSNNKTSSTAELKAQLLHQALLWETFIQHIYHKKSHEKYYRWSEEKIAVDLAHRCFLDGRFMDPFSDVEDHAIEICDLFVKLKVWRYCGKRVEAVKRLVAESL